MNVLTVNNLTKNYPSFKLDTVSFSLEEGKITGFIGRNGAGKSTTLNSLFNFVHPDGGEISFFGLDFK
ncbi:MAG: ATP-binding cassette domain-containing protein, partial [Oscillospiraceae bacterium]